MATYNEVRQGLRDACELAAPDDFNNYPFFPKGPNPPCSIVQPDGNGIDYDKVFHTGFAEWDFAILLVVGQLNEEAAQLRVGELITPGSAMITALNDYSGFEGGHVDVLRGVAGEIQIGDWWYASGRLTVKVWA